MKRILSVVFIMVFVVACSSNSANSNLPSSPPAVADGSSHSQRPDLTNPGCPPGTTQFGYTAPGVPNCVADGGGENSGGGGGSSGGGGGSCGGSTACPSPTQVATTKPEAGLNCDGSPFVLGTSNLPMNTSGSPTTVVDIWGLNSSNSTYGWLYYTQNNTFFFQRNAADASNVVSALTGFFSNVPGVSSLAQSLINSTTSPTPLTGPQYDNISSSWQSVNGQKIHSCFTGTLTLG